MRSILDCCAFQGCSSVVLTILLGSGIQGAHEARSKSLKPMDDKCLNSAVILFPMLQAKEVRPSQKMAASAASSAAKQEQLEQRCIYAVSWQASDVPLGLPEASPRLLGSERSLDNALVWKDSTGWHKARLSRQLV